MLVCHGELKQGTLLIRFFDPFGDVTAPAESIVNLRDRNETNTEAAQGILRPSSGKHAVQVGRGRNAMDEGTVYPIKTGTIQTHIIQFVII